MANLDGPHVGCGFTLSSFFMMEGIKDQTVKNPTYALGLEETLTGND